MGADAEYYEDYGDFGYWDDWRHDSEKPRVLVLVGDFMTTIYFSHRPTQKVLKKIKDAGGIYSPTFKSWTLGREQLEKVRQALMGWGTSGVKIRKARDDFEVPTDPELDWLNPYARNPKLIAPSEVTPRGGDLG